MKVARYVLVAVLLFSLQIYAVPFNFINRYRPFITGIALFETLPYQPLIGGVILLLAFLAGQYGFLPIRDVSITKEIEHIRHHYRDSNYLTQNHWTQARIPSRTEILSANSHNLPNWQHLAFLVTSWIDEFTG